jgi:NOL1/NOP2/fmu family ribosome biogenesis protein
MCDEFAMECTTLVVPYEWGIKEIKQNGINAYAFYPHLLKGEGFFISVLKKKNESGFVSFRKKNKIYSPLTSEFAFLNDWVDKKKDCNLYRKEDSIFLLPSQWLAVIEYLEQNLAVNYISIPIGEIKHSKVIPTHALAVSTSFNKNTFPQLILSKAEALKFLRKEELPVLSSEKGWTLAMFEDSPLGWLNNLGNRYNNYYPSEWRIRMKG